MGTHSPRTQLTAELISIAKKAGGSFLTKESRIAGMHTFSAHLKENGFTIASVHQIKPKHIFSYIQSCRDNGLGVRTIHNLVTHLRTVLRAAGRAQFVSDHLTREKLGLEKSCRDGTKYAMPDDRFSEILSSAMKKDKGVAAGLMLCRYLGLRSQEAVRSPRCLKQWLNILEGRSFLPIKVSLGTKGKRPRDFDVSYIPDLDAAIKAVKFALEVVAERNGRLIDKETLNQAINRWGNQAKSLGLQGEYTAHSLRYAFTVDALKKLQAKGLPKKQALEIASRLLGHGEDRSRWVKQVYSREAPMQDSAAADQPPQLPATPCDPQDSPRLPKDTPPQEAAPSPVAAPADCDNDTPRNAPMAADSITPTRALSPRDDATGALAHIAAASPSCSPTPCPLPHRRETPGTPASSSAWACPPTPPQPSRSAACTPGIPHDGY